MVTVAHGPPPCALSQASSPHHPRPPTNSSSLEEIPVLNQFGLIPAQELFCEALSFLSHKKPSGRETQKFSFQLLPS